MDIPTAILAAVIGSIVAGVISIIVNLSSLALQFRFTILNNERTRRMQWRTESSTLAKELKREALRMELSEEGIEEIRPTIDDLRKQRAKIPQKHKDSEIESKLDELEWYLNKYDQEQDMLVSSLRDHLIEVSDNIQKELESLSREDKVSLKSFLPQYLEDRLF